MSYYDENPGEKGMFTQLGKADAASGMNADGGIPDAFGAGGGRGSTPTPPQMHDPGPSAAPSAAAPSAGKTQAEQYQLGPSDFAGGALNGFGGVWDMQGAKRGGAGMPQFFSQGGNVEADPDDTGEGALDTRHHEDKTSQALDTVDKIMEYGRQKSGLSGGQQEASAMPMRPAGQSESGVQPAQPAPGRLPPTSNPFGKRADAGGIPDDDTQSLAEGGDVEDTSNDQPQQPEQAQPQGQAPQQPEQMGQDPQQVIRYLSGADAAPPEQLAAVNHAVDPHGEMSKSDRAVLAVDQAAKEQGPDAAWALVQANRREYDHRQAFARAALMGTDGKPPDPDAAAHEATKAYSHMLDGSDVSFVPSGQNFTATVKQPGQEPQTVTVSKQGMEQWLNTGEAGQYDNMKHNGPLATLQQLAAKFSPIGSAEAAEPAAPGAPAGADAPKRYDPSKSMAENQKAGTAGPDAPQVDRTGQPIARGKYTDSNGQEHETASITGTKGDYGQTPGDTGPVTTEAGRMLDPQYAADQKDDETHQRAISYANGGGKNRMLMDYEDKTGREAQKDKIDEMRARNPMGVAELRSSAYSQRTSQMLQTAMAKIQAGAFSDQLKAQARLVAVYMANNPGASPDEIARATKVDLAEISQHAQAVPQQSAAPAGPNTGKKPPPGWVRQQ